MVIKIEFTPLSDCKIVPFEKGFLKQPLITIINISIIFY